MDRLIARVNTELSNPGNLSARAYTPLSARDLEINEADVLEEAAERAEPDIMDVLSANVPDPLGLDRGNDVEFCGLDIVQFSSAIYYADTSLESHLMIDVIRLGSMSGEAQVEFQTQDGSAKAGVAYAEASGVIVFAHGISSMPIKIDILPGTAWTATLEFKLKLSVPGNCELGVYLKIARIKLMDSQLFPSDRYRSVMENPEATQESLPGWGLLWEYIKLNFRQEGMAWRTLIILMFDQLENLYLLCMLQLNIYLVDVVLNTKDPESQQKMFAPSRTRAENAVMVGGLFAVPQVASHVWEYARLKTKTAGKSRAFLQTNLFRKYMNYNEASRRDAGNVDVDIIHNSPEVAGSYMMALNLVKQMGRLGIMLGFMLHHSTEAWWVILLMPSLLLVYAMLDPQDVGGAQEVILAKTKRVSILVGEVNQKYELIADYNQRPRMNHMFLNEVAVLNKALLDQAVATLNWGLAPPHLGSLFTSLWIAWKSQAVLNGEMSLGTLLAMMGVFGKMAGAFDVFFLMALSFKANIAVLRKMTRLFNMQTDVPFLKDLNRSRRALTKVRRENALEDARGSEFKRPVTDTLPLETRNVAYAYGSTHSLLRNVNVSVHQSSLVAVTAEHGGGRRTLMRLLANKIFPDSGMVSIPTHLRVLHVSEEPMLLSLPAWENLTFACPDENPQRVLEIIELLGMASIKPLVEQDIKIRRPHEQQDTHNSELEFSTEWMEQLSKSEQTKVNLARAFIMNPEVLVLQHPLKHFNEANAQVVMSAIKNHIEHRGIAMPAASMGRRRPRTVFMTVDDEAPQKEADVIWRIKPDGSVGMLRPPAKEFKDA